MASHKKRGNATLMPVQILHGRTPLGPDLNGNAKYGEGEKETHPATVATGSASP